MTRDNTATIIRHYVRQTGDADIASIARETGIPVYIVQRYVATINDAQQAYYRAQREASETNGGTAG